MTTHSTRQRVIDAGAKVFAEGGLHAASKERIGAVAGFTHQTVRDYFPRKEDLLNVIVASVWRSVLDAIKARSDLRPLERLTYGFDTLVSLKKTRPNEWRCAMFIARFPAGPLDFVLNETEQRDLLQVIERMVAVQDPAMRAANAEMIMISMQAFASSDHTVEAQYSFRSVAVSMLNGAK